MPPWIRGLLRNSKAESRDNTWYLDIKWRIDSDEASGLKKHFQSQSRRPTWCSAWAFFAQSGSHLRNPLCSHHTTRHTQHTPLVSRSLPERSQSNAIYTVKPHKSGSGIYRYLRSSQSPEVSHIHVVIHISIKSVERSLMERSRPPKTRQLRNSMIPRWLGRGRGISR